MTIEKLNQLNIQNIAQVKYPIYEFNKKNLI